MRQVDGERANALRPDMHMAIKEFTYSVNLLAYLSRQNKDQGGETDFI